MERVQRTRPTKASLRPREESRSPIVRVDDARAPQQGPEPAGSTHVRLASHRHGGGLDPCRPELGRDRLARTDDVDIDAFGRDGRSQDTQMRQRPTSLDRRHVDDLHAGVASRS